MGTLFDAAMSGYNAADKMIRSERAHRAAREKYGDIADDPGLFSAIQQIELDRNRDTRATEQQNFNQDMRLRREKRDVEKHTTDQSHTQDDRKKDGILNLVNGLREARDNGDDLGEAFDSMVKNLGDLGVSEEDIPGLREELLANPAILDQYHKALTDPGKGKGGLSASAQAKADAKAASTGTAIQDSLMRLDILEGVGLDKADAKEWEEIQSSVFGLPTPSKMWQGGFGMMGAVPSSAAADYVVNMEAMMSDVRSMAFETLKGGGHITEKESEFARDAIANISRSTSVQEYRRELKRLRNYLMNVEKAQTRRRNGETVPDTPFTTSTTADTTPDAPVKKNPNYESTDGATANKIWIGMVDEKGDTYVGPGPPTEDENWRTPAQLRAERASDGINDRIRKAQQNENDNE